MGYLQSTSASSGVNSHLYSQALQMKLYQAFIFSIPILFSIILFLLFYLFYLKRTFSNNNSSNSGSSIPPQRSSRNQDASTLSIYREMGSKVNLEEKLNTILFDEDLYVKDSMCCVCLGEFKMNEKLHQIPSCQHMFHVDCIRNWLHSNITCPLCRCLVISTAKEGHQEQPMVHEPPTVVNVGSNPQRAPFEHSVVILEGSSSSSMDTKFSHQNDEFVAVDIPFHDS